MRSIASPSWIERALGLDPLPVPPHVFAVEGEELRYGAFLRSGEGFLFQEFHSARTPPRLFGKGILGSPAPDVDALESVVRSLVARISSPVHEASLVLPDGWLRAIPVELGVLPRDREPRLEVLRFKLKRLVPYRIDDLRIEATPLTPLASQEEPLRALAGLAHEGVLKAFEDVFARVGIRVGQVTSASLGLVSAVAFHGRLPGLAALARVDDDGVVILFARDGEPVLVRQKSFTEELAEEDRAVLAVRELRLTKTFLAERLPDSALGAVLLAAPHAEAAFWKRVLEEGLERETTLLSNEHLPLLSAESTNAADLAPMLGAAARELA